MPDTRSLVFWMDGILTPSILDLSNNALMEMGYAQTNLLAIPGFRELSDRFSLGEISGKEYFKTLVNLSALDLNAEMLGEKTRQACLPQEQVLSVIRLLSEKLNRWLICDVPPEWLVDSGSKMRFQEFFAPEKILFLSDMGLQRILPDFWKILPGLIGFPRDQILFFDRDPKRVISAINHSFPAAVYVDPRRLEREFVIRGLISRPLPKHTPPVSV